MVIGGRSGDTVQEDTQATVYHVKDAAVDLVRGQPGAVAYCRQVLLRVRTVTDLVLGFAGVSSVGRDYVLALNCDAGG